MNEPVVKGRLRELHGTTQTALYIPCPTRGTNRPLRRQPKRTAPYFSTHARTKVLKSLPEGLCPRPKLSVEGIRAVRERPVAACGEGRSCGRAGSRIWPLVRIGTS